MSSLSRSRLWGQVAKERARRKLWKRRVGRQQRLSHEGRVIGDDRQKCLATVNLPASITGRATFERLQPLFFTGRRRSSRHFTGARFNAPRALNTCASPKLSPKGNVPALSAAGQLFRVLPQQIPKKAPSRTNPKHSNTALMREKTVVVLLHNCETSWVVWGP